MELAGRVALVTGGSGDLGAAICRALARGKMDVAVTYVGEQERAEHVVAEIESAGCRAWSVRLDQSTTDQPDQVVASAARTMKEQGDGRIVNVASIGGLYPASSSIAYSSTKAALIHLTRCLAVALAPSVLVNCVAPGLIEGTRMAGRLPDAVREGAIQRAVLRRAATVEDIAEQVVTFCRTDSINGQVMPIDAGSVFN